MLRGRIREAQSISGGARLVALVQLLMPLCASAADKGTELGLNSEKWYFEYELKSWAKQVTLDNIRDNPRGWVEFIVVISAVLYILYRIGKMMKDVQSLTFSYDGVDDDEWATDGDGDGVASTLQTVRPQAHTASVDGDVDAANAVAEPRAPVGGRERSGSWDMIEDLDQLVESRSKKTD